MDQLRSNDLSIPNEGPRHFQFWTSTGGKEQKEADTILPSCRIINVMVNQMLIVM